MQSLSRGVPSIARRIASSFAQTLAVSMLVQSQERAASTAFSQLSPRIWYVPVYGIGCTCVWYWVYLCMVLGVPISAILFTYCYLRDMSPARQFNHFIYTTSVTVIMKKNCWSLTLLILLVSLFVITGVLVVLAGALRYYGGPDSTNKISLSTPCTTPYFQSKYPSQNISFLTGTTFFLLCLAFLISVAALIYYALKYRQVTDEEDSYFNTPLNDEDNAKTFSSANIFILYVCVGIILLFLLVVFFRFLQYYLTSTQSECPLTLPSAEIISIFAIALLGMLGCIAAFVCIWWHQKALDKSVEMAQAKRQQILQTQDRLFKRTTTYDPMVRADKPRSPRTIHDPSDRLNRSFMTENSQKTTYDPLYTNPKSPKSPRTPILYTPVQELTRNIKAQTLFNPNPLDNSRSQPAKILFDPIPLDNSRSQPAKILFDPTPLDQSRQSRDKITYNPQTQAYNITIEDRSTKKKVYDPLLNTLRESRSRGQRISVDGKDEKKQRKSTEHNIFNGKDIGQIDRHSRRISVDGKDEMKNSRVSIRQQRKINDGKKIFVREEKKITVEGKEGMKKSRVKNERISVDGKEQKIKAQKKIDNGMRIQVDGNEEKKLKKTIEVNRERSPRRRVSVDGKNNEDSSKKIIPILKQETKRENRFAFDGHTKEQTNSRAKKTITADKKTQVRQRTSILKVSHQKIDSDGSPKKKKKLTKSSSKKLSFDPTTADNHQRTTDMPSERLLNNIQQSGSLLLSNKFPSQARLFHAEQIEPVSEKKSSKSPKKLKKTKSPQKKSTPSISPQKKVSRPKSSKKISSPEVKQIITRESAFSSKRSNSPPKLMSPSIKQIKKEDAMIQHTLHQQESDFKNMVLQFSESSADRVEPLMINYTSESFTRSARKKT